jgi:endonuclease YncB( thermonuclease family)
MIGESLLRLATTNNVTKENYDGVFVAKVVSVYDGDTCDVVFSTHDSRLVRETIRIYGIDTPEMRGGSVEDKQRAMLARSRLIELTCGVTLGPDEMKTGFPDHRLLIKMQTYGKRDNFGRLLGTLYPYDTAKLGGDISDALDFNESFNQVMINERLAVIY